MRLNLPVLDQLAGCKNLLIAGMGGGFDVFCGLPIYFELRERGQNVHLANYSFSGISGLQPGGTVRLSPTLVGVTANYERKVVGYFPELYLAQWFQQARQEDIMIWCFQPSTIISLTTDYQTLIEHLKVDGILLIDGGVDSLVRGDEMELGTWIEDTVSLVAVSKLENLPTRLVACLGLGAERDLTYAHILENIATLAKAEYFLGSCSLLKQMPTYQKYKQAVTHVFEQTGQQPSVINASVISAVEGEFGNYHLTERTKNSQLWISPLMSQYMFFDLMGVAQNSAIVQTLAHPEWRMLDLNGMGRIFDEQIRPNLPLRPYNEFHL